MNIRGRHIIILLFLLVQTVASSQSLIEFLEANKIDTQFCESYMGIFDGAFEMELQLCESVGAYKMTSSNEIYLLDIEQIGESLELTEWDERNQNSGIITLQKNKEKYIGRWKHTAKPAAYEVLIAPKVDSIEPAVKFITRLSGIINKEIVNIDIYHETQEISLINRFGDQREYITPFKCDNDDCRKMTIAVEGYNNVDELNIRKLRDNKYKLTTFSDSKRINTSELTVEYERKYITKTYADYRSLLFAEYPDMASENLNEFLDNLQTRWIQSTSKSLRSIIKEDQGTIVDDRLKFQSFSWVEIEVNTKDLVSGVLYYQSSWAGSITAEPFHFNIDKSREEQLDNIWKENVNINEFFKNDSNNIAPSLLVSEDGIYHIMFDRIKGAQKTLFTYTDLEKYINNRSWLGKLVDDNKLKN